MNTIACATFQSWVSRVETPGMTAVNTQGTASPSDLGVH
jgi:hypothetical protein